VTSLRILLVRHGQSEWNAQGRWQGQADPPLTELGRAQARRAAERLTGLDAIVASDLQRAHHTARIMATALSLSVERLEPRLRERHAGPWQGLTHAQIERRWPGWIRSNRRPEGYEPDHLVASRGLQALQDLADQFPGASLMGVSHSGTIRAMVHQVNGRETRLANLAGVWFELSDGRLTVGDDLHLLADETFTRVE
jgi:probable phosphoglycerate mutase